MAEGPGHRIWRGRRGRHSPHLDHKEEEGGCEPRQRRRRRHVGRSPSQASPDVSQQRPVAERGAAQAPYVCRACVRIGVKGCGGGACAEGRGAARWR